MTSPLDARPIVVAVAGPNGAGKTTFYAAHLSTRGYTVVLCFIGLDSPELCDERVAMRVLQGGHDVPTEKLARYPRTLENLARAIRELPHVLVFDNSALLEPFREVALPWP